MENIINKDAYWILKAAHVLGVYDSESTRVSSYNITNPVLIQDIYWHGIVSGTSYHTTFKFTVTCSNPEVIDNLNIEAIDTKNPPPAWLGTTVVKNVAILALIEEITVLRGAAAYANAMRSVNVAISVKDALAYVLKYLASG